MSEVIITDEKSMRIPTWQTINNVSCLLEYALGHLDMTQTPTDRVSGTTLK